MCRDPPCPLYSESGYTDRTDHRTVHTRYEAEGSPPRLAVPAPWTARLLASCSVTVSLRRHSRCAPIAFSATANDGQARCGTVDLPG
jgi:hypothetical protein